MSAPTPTDPNGKPLSQEQLANVAIIREVAYAAGYDDRIAQAMIANAYAESGIKNNGPAGDNGHAFGLFQLNNAGGAGIGHSEANMRDPYFNTRTILADYGMKKVAALWSQGADAPTLADAFCRYVERPADSTKKGAQRADYARRMFSNTTTTTTTTTTTKKAGGAGGILLLILGLFAATRG